MFIYDSRAIEAISELNIDINKYYADIINLDKDTIDKDYASFFCKCLIIKNIIESKAKTIVTPRTIDNILLDMYDRKPKKSKQPVSTLSEVE